MNLSFQHVRQQGMNKLLDQAGTTFAWYQKIDSTTGNPAIGMGASPVYSTAYLTGIWQAMAQQREFGQAGGQTVEGAETIYSRSKPGTADKLSYGGATYEIVAVPWECKIQDVLYWRIQLKRG